MTFRFNQLFFVFVMSRQKKKLAYILTNSRYVVFDPNAEHHIFEACFVCQVNIGISDTNCRLELGTPPNNKEGSYELLTACRPLSSYCICYLVSKRVRLRLRELGASEEDSLFAIIISYKKRVCVPA